MRRTLIAVGLCVALAAPAAASGAEQTYKGRVKGGGHIKIVADVVDRHATEVSKMTFKGVPAHCEVTNGAIVGASYTFANLLVNANNRFKFNHDFSGGEHLLFKGTFRHHAKKVEGSFRAELHFTGPSQDCTTGKRGYSAHR